MHNFTTLIDVFLYLNGIEAVFTLECYEKEKGFLLINSARNKKQAEVHANNERDSVEYID